MIAMNSKFHIVIIGEIDSKYFLQATWCAQSVYKFTMHESTVKETTFLETAVCAWHKAAQLIHVYIDDEIKSFWSGCSLDLQINANSTSRDFLFEIQNMLFLLTVFYVLLSLSYSI